MARVQTLEISPRAQSGGCFRLLTENLARLERESLGESSLWVGWESSVPGLVSDFLLPSSPLN